MQIVAPSAPVRVRPVAFIAVGAALAALLAAALLGVLGLTASITAAPFAPRAADGLIPEGASVSIDDAHLPAIAQLEPALADAVRDAATGAAASGVTLDITSGWRSTSYQQWLLDQAIETYGSAEIARQFVATAEESSHVRGEAVDVGSLDAQSWLAQHGAGYGLCQVYANEPWHFERLVEPGQPCPQMVPDASAERGA